VHAALFDETLKTCRRLYNHALAERKTAYTERGETLAFARQSAALPQLNQTWHSLKRVHSQVLQDVLHRLQHAFGGGTPARIAVASYTVRIMPR
jgi:putative transposase